MNLKEVKKIEIKKTSTTMKINKTSNALRTNIPVDIQKQMNLTEKDLILWHYDGKDVKVKKVE